MPASFCAHNAKKGKMLPSAKPTKNRSKTAREAGRFEGRKAGKKEVDFVSNSIKSPAQEIPASPGKGVDSICALADVNGYERSEKRYRKSIANVPELQPSGSIRWLVSWPSGAPISKPSPTNGHTFSEDFGLKTNRQCLYWPAAGPPPVR